MVACVAVAIAREWRRDEVQMELKGGEKGDGSPVVHVRERLPQEGFFEVAVRGEFRERWDDHPLRAPEETLLDSEELT